MDNTLKPLTIESIDNRMVDLIEEKNELISKVKVHGTPYTLFNYKHGRCHVFAQALHEELGYKMQYLWDEDYWFKNEEYASEVLVHAYCELPTKDVLGFDYVDASGFISKDLIELEFECNKHNYEDYTMEAVNDLYEDVILERPAIGEIEALRTFIRLNKEKYER